MWSEQGLEESGQERWLAHASEALSLDLKASISLLICPGKTQQDKDQLQNCTQLYCAWSAMLLGSVAMYVCQPIC